jgi:hypothetical protein
VGLGAALGAGAGTFGGAVLIGAASGMAGAATGYGASYGMAWVANQFGANINTSGYTWGGLAQTMAVGALTGAAMGGGVWGAQKAYGLLSSGSGTAGNGSAGQSGPAGTNGQLGRAAQEASAEVAEAPTATQAATTGPVKNTPVAAQKHAVLA